MPILVCSSWLAGKATTGLWLSLQVFLFVLMPNHSLLFPFSSQTQFSVVLNTRNRWGLHKSIQKTFLKLTIKQHFSGLNGKVFTSKASLEDSF